MTAATCTSSDVPASVQVRRYHEVTGDIICPSMVQGIDHLRDPRLNKVSVPLLCSRNFTGNIHMNEICFVLGISIYLGGASSVRHTRIAASTI